MPYWFPGDIVRIKTDDNGLFEVVSEHEIDGWFWVTNDECDSERIASESDFILVCRFGDRKDKEDD